MANKELYDYFSTATPDYNQLLNVLSPQAVIEVIDKNQDIQFFDDGSSRVITLSSTPLAQLTLRWHDGITESDAGIILDFFADPAKGNGYARSFKYYYPNDGHTYVVKFRTKISRTRSFLANVGFVPVDEVILNVEGVISD